MPSVKLTDITVRNLAPPEKGQVTYWDNSLSGFGIRLSQGGTKSFVVVRGVNRQRTTIGRYPVISLADARTEAKRLLAQHVLGQRNTTSITFTEAQHRFLSACEAKNKPRTVQDYKRLLDRHFRLGRVLVDDITQEDILKRVHKLRKTPSEQNHAFVAIRAFLRWCVAHQYLPYNPIEGLSLPARKTTRERTLTDDEIAEVYTKAYEMGFPYGYIVCLILLTGQRPGEIAHLRWEWIEDNAVTLPAEATKNGKTHTFPINELATEILSLIPRTSEYVFPASRSHFRGNPTTVFNGWSKCKKELDSVLKDVEPFTNHDLRRTFATKLAELGVPIHITEKLLNHTGTLAGVAGIYNRYTYFDEMRDAVLAYEQFLATLTGSHG